MDWTQRSPRSFRGFLKFFLGAGGPSSRAGGFSRVFLVEREPAVVRVTEASDDRDPEFVIANRRRAGPTTAVCYRVTGHVGCVVAGPDRLAADADGAFSNASTIATCWPSRAGLEPLWPVSAPVAQSASRMFSGQRRFPVPASVCRIDQPKGAFLVVPPEAFWIGVIFEGLTLRRDARISALFNGSNRRERY